MKIAVHQSRGVDLSNAGREYAAGRLTLALLRSRDHVQAARIYLADANGPKGGADKMCTVTVALDHGRPVTVVERAGTLTAAMDGAAHRAGQTVLRVVEKRFESRRRLRALARAVKRLLDRRGGDR